MVETLLAAVGVLPPAQVQYLLSVPSFALTIVHPSDGADTGATDETKACQDDHRAALVLRGT